MELLVNMKSREIRVRRDGNDEIIDLYSRQGFELISDLWLKIGWNEKYSYTFTWMGRPIIQLPEDLLRAQEVIYRTKPDVIVETGIAHGGSLIFWAALCKAIGKGRVIGVDLEIKPDNRKAIEDHELFEYISFIEGSSVDPRIVTAVREQIGQGESVIAFLDSDHSKQHVAKELKAYAPLVTPGSYIVVTDGIMRSLTDVPRGNRDWEWDNPVAAALEFASNHPEFLVEIPNWEFNESQLSQNVTHWPLAWLKRKPT